MARKQINIFGTSFLDLLSGALAAVIILFVVVPKGIQEDPEIVKEVQEIKAITSDIKTAIETIKNSVPKEVLEKIQKEFDSVNKKLEELNEKIDKLEVDIKQIQQENVTLKQKVKEQEDEIAKLKQQVDELNKEIEEIKQKNSTANTVEKTLGVFAKFGIICKWNEADTDVDMGVQRFGSSPEQCWRNFPSKKWGILGEDVRERIDDDSSERFELFYVPQIYPDEYTAWVNIYEGSSGSNATVNCILVFHPGKEDEQKKEIGPFNITKGGPHKLVVSFRLTNSGFEIINTREPIWGNGRVEK